MTLFENTEISFANKNIYDLRKAYWLFKIISNPQIVKISEKLVKWALVIHFPLKWVIKPLIFKHFCGGETQAECNKTIEELSRYNIGSILDYSVEGKEKDDIFEKTATETIMNIHKAKNNKHIPFCVFKVTGLAKFTLLEKLSSNASLSALEIQEYQSLRKRVEAICHVAGKNLVQIFFDAEESWIQPAIDNLAEEMMKTYNKEKTLIFNTIQLYRHDRLNFLKESYQKASEENYFLGVKLVRGAYMEKERNRAGALGYPSPIQVNKAATDKDFDAALSFCMDHLDKISFCSGTHNEQSCTILINLIKDKNIGHDDTRIWFAQLFGMSDNISYNLAFHKYNTAKYVPYGPVNELLPYLIRRSQENTSVKGQTSRELTLISNELKRRTSKNNVT